MKIINESKITHPNYECYSYTGSVTGSNGYFLSDHCNTLIDARSEKEAREKLIKAEHMLNDKAGKIFLNGTFEKVSVEVADTNETCPQCKRLLDDSGNCPYCDYGEED